MASRIRAIIHPRTSAAQIVPSHVCLLDAKGDTNRRITIGSGVFVGRNTILSSKSGAFDISRARAELGYAPAVGLREGIRRTLGWYRQTGWI